MIIHTPRLRRSLLILPAMIALAHLAGCADRKSQSAEVVNYQSHSGLTQRYQVAVEQQLMVGAGKGDERRVVHLISSEMDGDSGAAERSSVLYAVTDQNGTLVSANRCSANIVECSARIAEMAQLSCDAKGCFAVPEAGVRVINQKLGSKLAVGLTQEILTAFSSGDTKLEPEVECTVRLVDAIDGTPTVDPDAAPYRVYVVVSGTKGRFVGGQDCSPNEAIGQCGRWIARRAAQMCMDAMESGDEKLADGA